MREDRPVVTTPTKALQMSTIERGRLVLLDYHVANGAAAVGIVVAIFRRSI